MNSIILKAVENSTQYTVTVTLPIVLTVLLSAIGCGALLSLVYYITQRKKGFSISVIISTLLVAPAASLIVLVIVLSRTLVAALSVGGGLALIRYRTTFDNPKDVTYVFASLAIGMACGLGFVSIAAIATAIFCVVFILVSVIFTRRDIATKLKLRILVPESLDYYGIFEPVLDKYCTSSELVKIKTEDYGTLLRLDYIINIKDLSMQKQMIDDIRCSNGNLSIAIVKMNLKEND